MRHRSAAAHAAQDSREHQGDGPAAETPKKRPTHPPGQDPKWLILVFAVLLIPLVVIFAVKMYLPAHHHDKIFQKPTLQASLTSAEVRHQIKHHTMLHLGGVHRSGVMLLWQALGNHSSVSAMGPQHSTDPRVSKRFGKGNSEGVNIQTLYPRFGLDHEKFMIKKSISRLLNWIPFLPEGALPWMRLRQGVGRFALDPGSHLDEASSLVDWKSQQRLFCEWAILWDLGRHVLMEKSASNLLVAPFLHALWSVGQGPPSPRVLFIFVQRHPIAVALSTLRVGKKLVSDLTVANLVENWVMAEERRTQDLRQYFSLHDGGAGTQSTVRTIAFEDLCASPREVVHDIMKFLAISIDDKLLDGLVAKVQPDPNDKYFRIYCGRLLGKGKRAAEDHVHMVKRFGERVRAVSSYDLEKVHEICEGYLQQEIEKGEIAAEA